MTDVPGRPATLGYVPDYPDEIRQQAYAAVKAATADSYTWGSVADAVLDSVAEALGEHAAGKILAHMKAHGPAVGDERLGGLARARWVRHFETAARVAARAFLTEDDMRQIAVRKLAAGNFVACPAPEEAAAEEGQER